MASQFKRKLPAIFEQRKCHRRPTAGNDSRLVELVLTKERKREIGEGYENNWPEWQKEDERRKNGVGLHRTRVTSSKKIFLISASEQPDRP